jgi:hypothetical protein
MATTTNVRVPTDIHTEATRIAALRGQTPGELLAEAWKEFFTKHREHFAKDLEEAASIVRRGTTDELTAFVARGAKDRAQASAAAIRAKRK